MGRKSASRLEGDRYQHLYSWYVILELLDSAKQLDHVWLEHADAGAADDVTVQPHNTSAEPARYFQIKWHVDLRSGYSMASLIDSTGSTTSLLKKLWESWQRLRSSKSDVQVWLVSNWSPVPGDPLGKIIRGRDYRLDEHFLTARPHSDLARWRREWQDHLGADDQNLSEFCRALRFRLGFVSIHDLEQLIDERMRVWGLKFGIGPRSIAVDQVRAWIEEGGSAKRIDADVLEHCLRRLDLCAASEAEEGVAVAVHTWSVRAYDINPDYAVDWTPHFDHVTRRVPSPEIWNEVLLPELRALEREISRRDSRRYIRLRGSLSLSAALVFGHVFSVAGGYRLEIQHHSQLWRSDIPPDDRTTLDVVEEAVDDSGTDLLVTFSVTGEAKPEAVEFAMKQRLSVRAVLCLAPRGGPNDNSVTGASHAAALAQLARLELRRARLRYNPTRAHLFYCGPQSLAVLLGQKLNACGPIQLYEYQNPGYAFSCLLQ